MTHPYSQEELDGGRAHLARTFPDGDPCSTLVTIALQAIDFYTAVLGLDIEKVTAIVNVEVADLPRELPPGIVGSTENLDVMDTALAAMTCAQILLGSLGVNMQLFDPTDLKRQVQAAQQTRPLPRRPASARTRKRKRK
jgi:hypothetical protein